MKSKILFFILASWFICGANLMAYPGSFPELMDELLQNNTEYQQLILKYNQELSSSKLRKSLNLLDMNASYKSYENDIERVDTDLETESSDIFEVDERWQLELSKQFFPKDFDSTQDAVKEKFELYKLKQKIALTRVNLMEEILDDLLNWWEAEEKILLLENLFQTLVTQNSLLTNLAEDNLIKTELQIEQLEDLEKCGDDLDKSRKTMEKMQCKYETILSEFFLSYKQHIASISLPESAELTRIWNSWETEQETNIKPFYSYLKVKKLTPFLPEINFSLSWNWRDTEQEWEITGEDDFKTMLREQSEVYPEFGVELSIPLDFWHNSQSKWNILNNYQHNLQISEGEFSSELAELTRKRIGSYQTSKSKLKLKQNLAGLYEKQLIILEQKFPQQTDEINRDVQKARLKNNLAQIAREKANFELYKEVFLCEFINKGKL